MLADNKLALNAGWDEEILAEELKGLLADDLDFEIGLTGFSIPEVDLGSEVADQPDDVHRCAPTVAIKGNVAEARAETPTRVSQKRHEKWIARGN